MVDLRIPAYPQRYTSIFLFFKSSVTKKAFENYYTNIRRKLVDLRKFQFTIRMNCQFFIRFSSQHILKLSSNLFFHPPHIERFQFFQINFVEFIKLPQLFACEKCKKKIWINFTRTLNIQFYKLSPL